MKEILQNLQIGQQFPRALINSDHDHHCIMILLDSQDEVGTLSADCGSAGSAGSELPVPPVPAELARATPGERRSCGTDANSGIDGPCHL